MTRKEFKEAVAAGKPVILPIGATEAHGDHLPLSTDSLQPEYIAERLAEKCDAIIAPPIRYGVCNALRCFPGTISLSFDTMRALILDVLSELVRNGFGKIVVLSGHAGRDHMVALRLAARTIVKEKDVKIMVLSDYNIIYDKKIEEIDWEDGHGGTMETSRVMAIRPELVHKERAKPSFPKYPKYMEIKDFRKYIPEGYRGDPTKATKEFGDKLNDIIIEEMVKLIGAM